MSNREILELSEVIRESGLDWNAFIEEYQENGEDLHLSYDDFLAQCILESGYHKEQRQNDPLTNADRIRAMTDEELAEMLLEESESSTSYCDYCEKQSLYAPHCTAGNDLQESCINAIKNRLQQPYKEV